MPRVAACRPTGVGYCTHNRGGGKRCGRETDFKPDGEERYSVSKLDVFAFWYSLSISTCGRNVRCTEQGAWKSLGGEEKLRERCLGDEDLKRQLSEMG